MIKKRSFENLVGFLAGCSLFFLQGCGGDPGTSGLMVDYSHIPHTVPENHVDITHNIVQSTGNLLAVDIIVNQITQPAFNASLDLAYDPKVIRFLYHVPGSFLEATSSDPKNVTYAIAPQSTASNDLVIGVSQTNPDPGNTGSGILVTLVFEPVSRGCSVLNFAKLRDQNGNIIGEKSALVDPDGKVIGVTFSPGGTVRVRQEGDTGVCVPDEQTP